MSKAAVVENIVHEELANHIGRLNGSPDALRSERVVDETITSLFATMIELGLLEGNVLDGAKLFEDSSESSFSDGEHSLLGDEAKVNLSRLDWVIFPNALFLWLLNVLLAFTRPFNTKGRVD